MALSTCCYVDAHLLSGRDDVSLSVSVLLPLTGEHKHIQAHTHKHTHPQIHKHTLMRKYIHRH